MTGASAGAEDLVLGGEEALPAGRKGGTSRGRGLVAALVYAALAAGAGAALGVVAHPNPGGDGPLVKDLALTATAAVQSAQRSEARARIAETALADARQKLESLAAAGALQEYDDLHEAERLGLDRMIRPQSLVADDRKRVLVAIVRESRRNGLDPLLVAAIIQVESHFDPFAVSSVGACGLMQLMPPTANEVSGEQLKPKHLFNPVLNIELGTAYIARLFNRFGGDLRQALIAYNAGPSVARSLRHGSKSYRRLEAYPKAVLAAYRSLALAQQEAASTLAER
jgi:soluble lytic murein transglycosylase